MDDGANKNASQLDGTFRTWTITSRRKQKHNQMICSVIATYMYSSIVPKLYCNIIIIGAALANAHALITYTRSPSHSLARGFFDAE